MLDVQNAIIIRDAIFKYGDTLDQPLPDYISLEEVCRMTPIPLIKGGLTILAIQSGIHTIMVWVQFSNDFGITVQKIKCIVWRK